MPTTMSRNSRPIQQQADARNADPTAINRRIRQIRHEVTGRPSADALWFWLRDLVPAGVDLTGDGRPT
jgi:hypothetical protein